MKDNPGPGLDELDLKIVRVLEEAGRTSIPEVARLVGTSRPTAYARFDKLIESGAITGFHASVDHEQLGLTVTALLMVETEQSNWRPVAEELLANPSVVWLGLITGKADFAMLVRAEDLGHLRDVILDRLVKTPGVKSIVTNILLEELTSAP
ncbi:MAG: Lrp/AsnC family transcriptional regulator [Actinomycetota bacterium]